MNQATRSLRGVVSGGSLSRRVNTLSSDPGSKHNVDIAEQPKDSKGSAISNSGGEGYATRSDEAGFGAGELGGNAEENVKLDQEFNQDHPAYDKKHEKDSNEKVKSGGNHANDDR